MGFSAGVTHVAVGNGATNRDDRESARGGEVATGATNLDDGDTDGFEDVHARDLATGKTVLVSAGTPNLKDNGNSRDPSLSADGTRIAFDSSARQTPDGSTGQVFVRDVSSATTVLASR